MPNDNKFYVKRLNFSYWFVTNKLLLKNIVLAILIILIVFLAAMNLYILVFNFGIHGKSYQTLLSSFVVTSPDYVKLRQALLPQQIVVSDIKTFQNARGFDIVADIINPNTEWYAVFNYQFQIGDKLSAARGGFILPGENKKIIDLAVENGNLASQVIIFNVKWEKEIDFNNIYADKFMFEFNNIEYIPAQQLGIADKIQVNRVKFEGINKSAYNYQNVIFQVFLKSGDNIVGVNQLASGQFFSNEKKVFEVNFFQSLPRVTGVSIIPEINILDQKSFIKF